jgi:hypothetical protein
MYMLKTKNSSSDLNEKHISILLILVLISIATYLIVKNISDKSDMVNRGDNPMSGKIPDRLDEKTRIVNRLETGVPLSNDERNYIVKYVSSGSTIFTDEERRLIANSLK